MGFDALQFFVRDFPFICTATSVGSLPGVDSHQAAPFPNRVGFLAENLRNLDRRVRLFIGLLLNQQVLDLLDLGLDLRLTQMVLNFGYVLFQGGETLAENYKCLKN